MRLTAAITQEADWFVARCLEVEVASQGTSIEEALQNLREALLLYFEEAPLPEPGMSPIKIVPADPELQAWFEPQEAEAARAIAASTLTVRWDGAHVALVKQAAQVLGVPLSSYVKQVLVRQALADIETAKRSS